MFVGELTMKKFNLKTANTFMLRSSKILAVLEHNGIKVHTKRLRKSMKRIKTDIVERTDKLKKSKVWKRWRNKYGVNANLNSGTQLGDVFYNVMGNTGKRTATGIYKTDEESLRKLDHPFIREYLQIKKLEKCHSTYLSGIQRELDENGILHPNYNSHLAISYRTSSDDPNFQNLPIRNPEIGRIIRRLFISRFKGGYLVDRDYSGIEVAIALCYHQDPVMRKYLEDGYDFHKETAAQLYMLPIDKVTKNIRYGAKNKFVFPQFYGSYYVDCAINLWEWIFEADLKLDDGTPLIKHLKKKGIVELGDCAEGKSPRPGTFEAHVKSIEDDFWNRRFKVYTDWKKKVWNEYLQTGYVKYLNGFVAEAALKRNQVLNIGTQGVAAHCMIWSLNEIQKEIDKQKMKTVLIGQIHDSGLSDSPKEELQDFLQMSEEIVINKLKKTFPFINVPIKTEVEVSNKTWFDKKEWTPNKKGIWSLKEEK